MKLNIRQRVFRLVLSASVLTFLVLVGVALIGMFSIRYNLNERSTALSEYSTNYIQDVMKAQSKEELAVLAKAKANHIESELLQQSWDVRYLAEGMNNLLTLPSSDISRRMLPDPGHQTIHSGEAYIYYTPALLRQGINAAVAEEIARSCNISDLLLPFGSRYKGYISAFTVASENGYFICVETSNDGSDIDFSEEYFTTYDFRTRPWYEAVKNKTEPVFTDVYIDTEGLPILSCGMSYYNGNGDFAGVISIAYGI